MFLHIKLVKLQTIWKSSSGSGSGRICHSKIRQNPAPADWKK